VLVSITNQADHHLSGIVKSENAIGIELGVKGGGCAGFTYEWNVLLDIPDNHDIVPLREGKLYIKKEAMMLLMDTIIDFSTGINGNYIIFKNPNATSQCGCGESFGI
jgi:iron-sulfur cluster assembly accessory protein|tara:strand:- start:133 stop:453 length:321 start_codon:yes stop_codon:yes gene_type:complete